jgi:hypothetical protein
MQLIETKVLLGFVQLLYADGPTKEQSTEWVECRVKSEGDDNRRLGVVQANALRRVQALIAEENKRFGALADQSRQ